MSLRKKGDTIALWVNNTGMKLTLFFSLLLAASSNCLGAPTVHPQTQFNQRYTSSRIKVLNDQDPLMGSNSGRYAAPVKFMFESILGWVPEGKTRIKSEACRPHLWQDRLQDSRLKSVNLQGALIRKYLQECGEEIQTGDRGEFSNARQIMSLKLDPQNHPFFQRVVMSLPGGIKLKGLLLLKGDTKPRPMVVVRLGIFSSVEEFLPERYLAMQLFEQSPFNVLIVENMTSPDFIANNFSLSLGGYDEGLQNILIAKLLRDSLEPLSRLVHSVHFVGVSLGGHGVLFASLLNQFNGNNINSFTGICPVVHLRQTFANLTEKTLPKKGFDLWAQSRLSLVKEKWPTVETHERFGFLPKLLEILENKYRGGLSYYSGIKLPPGMQDTASLWGNNDFWPRYQSSSSVLVLATKRDDFVPFALNAATLKESNIKVVLLDEGFHCTLPIPYDWAAQTAWLQGYILQHAKGFKLEERSVEIDLADQWEPGFVDQKATIDFKVDEITDKGVINLSIVVSAKGDERSLKYQLPASSLDFYFHSTDLTESEKQMLTRWVYHNLQVTLRGTKMKVYWRKL